MSINVKSVTCPSCGARVKYDDNKKTAVCEFCGAVLDMTEEYGEKKDRERDDIQDMQIRHIMNNMNGRNRGNGRNDAAGSRRKVAVAVIAVICIFFVGSLTLSIVGGFMREAYTRSQNEVQETVTEINPFDKLTIKYDGISGAAKARLYDTNVNAVSSIEKSMTVEDKLSNGDKIIVKYGDNTVKQKNVKYVLTETEKEYTVYGLDEYVADITEVGEEDLEALKKNAIQKAISECDEDDFSYIEDSFKVYAVYTLVKKDYSKQMSVFIVSFDYKENGKKKTGYFMAKYSKAIRLATGEYKINFTTDLYSFMRETFLKGFNVSSAHSTWDAVYTDVYLNNKADWNIIEKFM